LTDDEGGHLIASIFKGPGEQINYTAMDGNLNKGAWKRMENKWAEAFDVTYFIDGKKKSVTLLNQAGG